MYLTLQEGFIVLFIEKTQEVALLYVRYSVGEDERGRHALHQLNICSATHTGRPLLTFELAQ